MSTFFLETGIELWDFVGVSIFFLLTMLFFFGIKNKKQRWLSYFMFVVFALQCATLILFRDALPTKLFAALMLTTVLAVGIITSRRDRENTAQF